jgi:hypoxanthine-DNA glycosylase
MKVNQMTKCIGFKAVSRPDAQILILGSLPGVQSLKQHQYYAKKQNSFWKIMGALLSMPDDLPYADRLKYLLNNKIALWDVCASATRKGSLDAHIIDPIPNDFTSFFKSHNEIRNICFNGQYAHKLFARLIMPDIKDQISKITITSLPSTSPAHASMSFDKKLSLWRFALRS